MKTAEEIAEKYVRGNHDALTDNQEIKDMAADIEEYASIKAEQARREEREKSFEMLEMLQLLVSRLEEYGQVWGYDEHELVGKTESLIKKATTI